MSIWKDFGDDRDEFFNSDEELRLNHEEFEQWLDSLEGEGTDEEKYNREMGARMDKEADEINQTEYPEWVITTPDYKMTISNN